MEKIGGRDYKLKGMLINDSDNHKQVKKYHKNFNHIKII